MAQFIVLHTYKKSPEAMAKAFPPEAWVGAAKSMAAGQMPAKCLKTWDPAAYGRLDYMVCLWEGQSAADVEATLKALGILEYITADIMQVDETDWAQLAQMGG